MALSPLAAHGTCLALVLLDLAARAVRIRACTRAVGHAVTPRQALQLNAWGDAAAGLTPMRVGGEAARLAGLLRAGVPAAQAFLAVGIEVVLAYPVVFAFGGILLWRYAPDWWSQAGPELRGRLSSGWPWVAFVGLLSVAAGAVAWRWRRVPFREPERGAHRLRAGRARLPWPLLLVCLPTSLINVAARTLVLPVLAATLPAPPPLGVLLVGSFVLLYSQLLLPTPAGAGAVDLALLGGAAGQLSGGVTLLLAWRFYTVGIGVLLGVALALRAFGLVPLRRGVARFTRRGRITPAEDPSPPA
ncbi:MAG: flippase-like domain-containing protein [Gemmatimonadetes bacterium]|nr:flippase-like domain-containing protein [Gemmatimonadota bacterium]